MPILPRLLVLTLGVPGRQRPPSALTSTSDASNARWLSSRPGSERLPISSSPSNNTFTFSGKPPVTASHASIPDNAIHSGDLSSDAPRAT